MKKCHSFALLLLFSALITSCSKKEDIAGTQNQDAVSVPTFSFKGPVTYSRDQYAAQTKDYISSANSYPEMFSIPFVPLAPSRNGNIWTWVWQAGGGGTETLTGIKSTDGTVSWELVLNGNIYGQNYSNRKMLDGTTSLDEKKGQWNIYDKNTTILVNTLSWTTDASGVVSGTVANYSYSTVTGKKEIINRPDRSGELTVYGENDDRTFQASWKPDGSGQWKSFINGQETANGSWK
ncbi:MAG: hypothetical protein ACM3P0_12030 [Acidobacteriota bacterium]